MILLMFLTPKISFSKFGLLTINNSALKQSIEIFPSHQLAFFEVSWSTSDFVNGNSDDQAVANNNLWAKTPSM